MLRRKSKGYTLLETMVVTTVMVAVAALTVVGYKHASAVVKKNRAKADIAAIQTSLDGFIAKRGHLPAATSADGVMREADLASILKQWGFLKNLKTDSAGRVVDPWDKPYVIILSRDYEARASEVLADANDDPLNDGPDDYQIYSDSDDDTGDEVDIELSNFPVVSEYQYYGHSLTGSVVLGTSE